MPDGGESLAGMLHRFVEVGESCADGKFGDGFRQRADAGIWRDFVDQGVEVIVEKCATAEDAAGLGQKEGAVPEMQAFDNAQDEL